MSTIIISADALLRIAADLNQHSPGHVCTVETTTGELVDIITPATAEMEA